MSEVNMKDVQKLLGPWSLEEAIKQRVDREALAEWALREGAPFEVIPDKASKPWALPTLYAVYSYIAL